MRYSIVNLDLGQVVPQRGHSTKLFDTLKRVSFPDDLRTVVFSPEAGYDLPPYRLYTITFVNTGSGPVVASESVPVFNVESDTVTVERVLESAPLPTTDDAAYDELMVRTDRLAKQLTSLIKKLNSGVFVPGDSLTDAQLKALFKVGLGDSDG